METFKEDVRCDSEVVGRLCMGCVGTKWVGLVTRAHDAVHD